MIAQRRTLKNEVRLEGVGLHSGVPVLVTLHPSKTGIVFQHNRDIWEAKPHNVSDTSLCTKLGTIATIEHLMSAFAGAEITDVHVEVSAPELPSLDGSAYGFFRFIQDCGTEAIGEIEIPSLFSRVFEHEGAAKIAIGAGAGHWKYEFKSETRYPFDQTFETEDILGNFESQIARARTFGWEDQQAEAAAMGIAQGLTMENCLLLGKDGPINPSEFADEPSRHKLLDAIGDLYLSGIPISMLNVACNGSGHKLNVQAAHRLIQLATSG